MPRGARRVVEVCEPSPPHRAGSPSRSVPGVPRLTRGGGGGGGGAGPGGRAGLEKHYPDKTPCEAHFLKYKECKRRAHERYLEERRRAKAQGGWLP